MNPNAPISPEAALPSEPQVRSRALLDPTFGQYVDAADLAREIAEDILAHSSLYQGAVRLRDLAWEKCEKSTQSKQASNEKLTDPNERR